MASPLEPLALLRPQDRRRLLRTDDAHLLGVVMVLNRTSRYRNRLDAVGLVAAIIRLRRIMNSSDHGC